jgi:hypothetical protein
MEIKVKTEIQRLTGTKTKTKTEIEIIPRGIDHAISELENDCGSP